jgi:NTP pyrophosphatase (non-canonical NTP hydrolase)
MDTNDKLTLLTEECAEVIQAATKCIRFTWEYNHPGYGVNHEVLAREVGDLLGVIDSLSLDQEIVKQYRSRKMEKAERLFELYSSKPN